MTTTAPLERIDLDFYPTPKWVVKAILPHLPPARTALDPAAGEGDILDLLDNVTVCQGIEIDPVRAAKSGSRCADALSVDWPLVDLIIGNPPFSHSEAFVRKAMQSAGPQTTIAMLVRITFLESAVRRPLHQQWPGDVYVLPTRPKFRGDTNGTDSVTACWMVWGPGRGGRWWVL